MSAKKIVLLVVGIAAGLTGLGAVVNATVFATPVDADAELATYTVRRGTLNVTLTETGNLVAQKSEKIKPEFRGSGKITFLVPEGEAVKKDDVLIKFDTKDAEKALEELEMQLLSKQTELEGNRTQLEVTKIENVTKIEGAKVALAKAEKELERYEQGDAPQEMRKLEIALADAMTQYNKAKKKLEDSRKLIELKYINQAELEDHEIAFRKAEVQKDEADLGIKLHNKYTLPMTTAEKKNAVEEQRRALETAEKRATTEVAEKTVRVQQSEKAVRQLEERIEQAKEDLAGMELKAPADGIVVYGDPKQPWYRQEVKIGGSVYRGYTVMTIPILSVMQVKLEVHEADISKVKQGLTALITMDTYPGLVLEGEVAKVALIAGGSDPYGNSNVKKFDVEITVPNEHELKPGISAKAEIQIDTLEEVVYVPLQCVFLEGGERFVHVANGSEVERRAVEVGLSSDVYIEVSKGLEAGEKVLLYHPKLAAPDSRDKHEESGDDAEAGSDENAADDAAEVEVAQEGGP